MGCCFSSDRGTFYEHSYEIVRSDYIEMKEGCVNSCEDCTNTITTCIY